MGKRTTIRRRSALAAGLATMAMALGFTAVPAEAAPPIAYVALGDSYAAGQGAGPYLDSCFRSDNSYAADADVAKSVRLVTNAACSGATTLDVAATQLGRLKKNTALVTITAGANDLNSTAVLIACLPAPSSANCAAALGFASNMLGTVSARLVGLVQAVHAAAPNAKIVLTGYPHLFEPVDTFTATANLLTDRLNTAIAAAADYTKTQYVDVTTAFAGHATNSTPAWINYDPLTPLAPDNFHPNASGYEAYYAALLAKGAYSKS
ncbi:Lipase 1 [Arthrobacter sp. Bi83]|jgi:lysophospholipase L1-like esterase|uniref:SGNH/GDSL hydrolase family protein n=1 Tax=Arthrobacter sp. Bi83 TaxID=2822353 RepID=UPI001E112A42|nr:SGNH/GDSL hydrolase family protein [Arthrobacter sp. Bi83]CAH0246823.1 Lipase 1 [Arthrobacter sp. Bi83]